MGFTREGNRDRKSVTCRTMAEAKREQAKLVAMRDARRNRISGELDVVGYGLEPLPALTMSMTYLLLKL